MKKNMWIMMLCMIAAVGLTACKPGDGKETTVSFESKVDETTEAIEKETTAEVVAETTAEETTEAVEKTQEQKDDMKKEPPVIMATGDKRLSEEELKKYADYFSEYGTWYTQALTSFYDSVKDVDLRELFYIGFKELDADGLTDAEETYLESLRSEDSCKLDTSRLPIEKMDEVLQKYFGISYEKTEKVGTDYLVYWEQTDSFYITRGDTNSTKMVPYAGVQRPNGNIVLFYEHEWSSVGYCMVTIKPVDGGIQIVANQKAPTSK